MPSIREVIRISEFSFDSDDFALDLRARTARGVFLTLGAQGIRLFLTIACTAVLARLLAPADFGLVAMTTAVTGLVLVFRDLGMSAAIIQRRRITHELVSTVFWVNLGVAVLLAAIVAASAPLLVRLYSDSRVGPLTVAFAVIIFVGAIPLQHQALLERQMRFLPLVVADLVAQLVGIFIAIGLAMVGAGYWALVALPATHAVLNALFLVGLTGWFPGKPARSKEISETVRFGSHLTGFNLVNYLARNLDNALIGWRWGSLQLGLYSRAYQLLMVPLQQVNAPVARVMIPALSRLADDPQRFRSAYVKAIEALTLVTIPLIGFLVGTSDWVIAIVLGDGWESAATIFAWLGLAAMTQLVGNSAGWLFISQGRTKEMLLWGFIGTSIAIASFLIGLPHGALGVAAAYTIADLGLRSPLLFWYVGRKGPVGASDFVKVLRFPLALALAMLASTQAIRLQFPSLAAGPSLLSAAALAALATTGLLRTRAGRERVASLRELVAQIAKPE